MLKCETCFSFPFHDISGNVHVSDVTLFCKSGACLQLNLPCQSEVSSALPAVCVLLYCMVLPFQAPQGRDSGIVRSSCSAAWSIQIVFPKEEFTWSLPGFLQELDIRPSKWGLAIVLSTLYQGVSFLIFLTAGKDFH